MIDYKVQKSALRKSFIFCPYYLSFVVALAAQRHQFAHRIIRECLSQQGRSSRATARVRKVAVFAGALQLDKAAVFDHHDVHVGFGCGVLGIV